MIESQIQRKHEEFGCVCPNSCDLRWCINRLLFRLLSAPHDERGRRDGTPEATQRPRSLELRQRCFEDGLKFFEHYKEINVSDRTTWEFPEFHFDGKLNTCLADVSYTFFNKEGASLEHDILFDIYSGQQLVFTLARFDKDGNIVLREGKDPRQEHSAAKQQFFQE